MCGISCIINRKGSTIDMERLSKMTDIIEHRGPDGHGYYCDHAIGLGHRRLAIIDLSEDGHQPFIDGNLVLVFNGEIYNYIEIRTELQGLGVTFRTKTDTEVLLKAYNYWGEECLHRFNGMWAFVIYDSVKKTVFASRDRFGIKPLYYYIDEDEILISSEIKQIHRVKQLKTNRRILTEFLQDGLMNYSEDTFFESVRILRQGHNLTFDFKSNTYQIAKYYDLNNRTSGILDISFSEASERFTALFEDAVRLRLQSDVDVALSLSGGLDSTSIAAVARKSLPSIRAFSAVYDEEGISEKEYLQAALDKLYLENHTISPTYEEMIDHLSSVVWYHDQPIPTTSSVVDYLLYKTKAKMGIGVSLNGQGADEILAGYIGFYKARLRELMNRHEYFTLLGVGVNLLMGRQSVLKQIKSQSSKINVVNHPVEAQGYYDATPRELSVRYITQSGFSTMLHSADRSSMASSVEARQPFLDYRLVEFCLRLPSEYKLDGTWTKKLLRSAMIGEVPDKIRLRKGKLGYSTPQERWFLENKNDIASDIRNHALSVVISSEYIDNLEKGKVDASSIIRILSSMRWLDTYGLVY